MKKIASILLLLTALTTVAFAQMVEPIHFSAQLKTSSTDEAEIIFTAKIDKGWHLYSTELGEDGPISASFHINKMDGAQTVGKLMPRGKEVSQFDNMFGMKLRFFEGTGSFVQKIKFTKANYDIDCYLEYGAGNDEMCLPPSQIALVKKGQAPVVASTEKKDADKTKDKEKQEPAVTMEQPVSATDSTPSTPSADIIEKTMTDEGQMQKLWKPVIEEMKAYDESTTDTSLFYIFLAGLVGGFLALFTPCVWPIIPMTVSFFLKRNKERKKAIREAVSYGVSIIVIYVLLGMLVTLLFGASALNALSTNAVFNIFFCLLLVVFAASFFGAFELTLPSSWSNKIDQKSESTSGILSIFLMAFTLALVSFSCTGPIIGFLLVAVSTQGNLLAPTIGMLALPLPWLSHSPSLPSSRAC